MQTYALERYLHAEKAYTRLTAITSLQAKPFSCQGPPACVSSLKLNVFIPIAALARASQNQAPAGQPPPLLAALHPAHTVHPLQQGPMQTAMHRTPPPCNHRLCTHHPRSSRMMGQRKESLVKRMWLVLSPCMIQRVLERLLHWSCKVGLDAMHGAGTLGMLLAGRALVPGMAMGSRRQSTTVLQFCSNACAAWCSAMHAVEPTMSLQEGLMLSLRCVYLTVCRPDAGPGCTTQRPTAVTGYRSAGHCTDWQDIVWRIPAMVEGVAGATIINQ